MRRPILLIIAAVLAIAAVAIAAAVVWPSSDPDSDRVAEAMEVLPNEAGTVTITDLARARERLGYGDLTSESPESEIDDYLADAAEEQWVASTLGPYHLLMDGWGWSFVDVEWEASYVAEDVSATAFKLRDDLDMEAVMDGFTDRGYQAEDAFGYPAFELDPADASGDAQAIPPLLQVVMVPDQHLMLTGATERVLSPAVGAMESLADSDVADDLAAQVDDPEFLTLSTGEPACVDPLDLLGRSTTPESLDSLRAALAETPGYLDLRGPAGHAAAITVEDGKPVAEAVVAYDDSAAAEADAEARQAFLDNADSLVGGQPYTTLLDATAESDGALIRYDFASDEVGNALPDLIQSNDLPWAFCSRITAQ